MSGSRTVAYVLEAFDAYVMCALWSSTYVDDQGDDVSMDTQYEPGDIGAESQLTMLRDVVDFVADNLRVLQETPDYVRGRYEESARSLGHDLWLTRNQHGAGFWDRGLGPVGQHLTDAAHAIGTSDLYVGDDGRVYLS